MRCILHSKMLGSTSKGNFLFYKFISKTVKSDAQSLVFYFYGEIALILFEISHFKVLIKTAIAYRQIL